MARPSLFQCPLDWQSRTPGSSQTRWPEVPLEAVVPSAHPSSTRPVLGREGGRNVQSAQHRELGHVEEKRSHNSDFSPYSIAICLLHRFFDRVGEGELVLTTKEDRHEKKMGSFLVTVRQVYSFQDPGAPYIHMDIVFYELSVLEFLS